jgi:hypothetical protein
MNQPEERNWWDRNWKWFVPVSALAWIALFVGVIGYLLFGFVRSSEIYEKAVAKAKRNSAVMEALGAPVKVGLLVTGRIKIGRSSGKANLAIPISGPKGKAKIYAMATKSDGKWTFSTLEVVVKTSGERINLLFADPGTLALFLGTWEYRQKNTSSPSGYDDEGERLELIQVGSSIQGLYFGLERTGDHGLWYTLVKIKDIKVSTDGEIAFTVPGRDIYRDRPRSLEDIEKLKDTPNGYTRMELKFRGELKNGHLVLQCLSEPIECPEEVMVFRKGKWTL